jgi:hypothetical protein
VCVSTDYLHIFCTTIHIIANRLAEIAARRLARLQVTGIGQYRCTERASQKCLLIEVIDMKRKIILSGLLMFGLLASGCSNPLAPATSAKNPSAPGTAVVPPTTAGGAVTAEKVPQAQDATPAIVAATNAFLATLGDDEKKTAQFDWSDTAQKQRWSNFPEGAFKHAGLMWGNMSEPQRNAWLAVMKATLSTEGFARVLAEWNGDGAVATSQGSGGRGASFGIDYYFIAIIGTPSQTTPWQWQWGGHHVTINATIAGPNVALTPSFIGLEPVSYTDAAGKTVRALGDIEDEAFKLINSLDAAQQQTAVLGATTIDLVLGPGQDGKTMPAEGLPAAAMSADQKTALLTLIGHYTGLVNAEDAAARSAEVKATLDQTYLGWYGPTVQGSPAYFRISGPALVIEYSAQGNRGGAAGSDYHVHGMYRDPTNDYGAKFAK